MIKIEKVDVFNLENAIRGMRNPLNSWERSDSKYKPVEFGDYQYTLGEDDLNLCKRLISAGTEHRKFMRQIIVSVDITAPLYWWKEFDTYKVGTTANSCSTMHKLHSKPIEIGDFSYDKLHADGINTLLTIINFLNNYREEFNRTNNKDFWYGIIQLLPSSYNQKRTITLNYEVLLNAYFQRGTHKLHEWHDFCAWVRELPYMPEFIESCQ